MKPGLILLDSFFTIHQMKPAAELPALVLDSPFFAMMRTDDELSLVLPESLLIDSDKSDAGWACFKVQGPLEFSLVGVLAGISAVLAQAGISIFALSSFKTDYILVKREQAEAAFDALASAGYTATREKS